MWSNNFRREETTSHLSKSIDNFRDDYGVVTEQWLNHLQITADLHDWPDAVAFQVAKSHLIDKAKFWQN